VAQSKNQNIRLSDLIIDPMVADAFRRAENSTPPAALAVAVEPDAPLAPGAVAELVEA